MLLLTVSAALDFRCSMLLSGSSSAHTTGASEDKFMSELNAQTDGWPDYGKDPYRYMFLLIFSIYCKRIIPVNPNVNKAFWEPKVTAALKADNKIFDVLKKDLIDATWFKHLRPHKKLPLCEICCELLNSTICSHSEVLRQCADEGSNFHSFLVLIASLCNLSPSCTFMLIPDADENNASMTQMQPFDEFIRNLRNLKEHQSELQVPYINLLASLCNEDGSGCEYVFNKLGDQWRELCNQLGQRAVFRDQPLKFHAILNLIQAVLHDHSLQERVTRNRAPMDILFWLLSHKFMRPGAKGSILDTLAALGNGNPGVMRKIWQKIEGSRIIPRPSPNQLQQSFGPRFVLPKEGIVKDLEEVETKIGTYGLTISFGKLVNATLTSLPVLIYKVPMWQYCGIGPYLKFLVDHVLLRLDVRTYKKECEHQKWEMAAVSLDVIGKILQDFNPLESRSKLRVSPMDHPGMALMLQLGNGDLLFKMLVKIIAKAEGEISKALDADGDALLSESVPEHIIYIEKVLILALRIFDISLEKEVAFHKLLNRPSSGRSSKYISGLLLESIVSRENDIVISIAKCIGFVHNSAVQEMCFHAARIINFLSHRGGKLIVAMAEQPVSRSGVGLGGDLKQQTTNSGAVSRRYEICKAFAMQFSSEHLKADSPETHADSRMGMETSPSVSGFAGAMIQDDVKASPSRQRAPGSGSAVSQEDWSTKCKVVLIQILLNSLANQQGMAELACMILGFNIGGNQMYDQDEMEVDELMCLDDILGMATKPRFSETSPGLAEGCFELFYRLYAHPRTSYHFSSYLQRRTTASASGNDVESSGASKPILFQLLDSLHHAHAHTACTLLQRAWLLKSIALDVYSTSRRGDRWSDIVKNVLSRLGFWQSGEGASDMEGYSTVYEQKRMRMLELLDGLSVRITPPKPLPTTIANFHVAKIRRQVSPKMYDYNLQALDAVASNNMSPAQRKEIMQLGQDWNRTIHLLRACEQAIEGWRQLAEVSLHEGARPQHGQADASKYDSTLHNLLSGMLQKLCSDDFMWQWLGHSLSAVALTVMAKIRLRAKLNIRGDASSLASRQHVLEEILQAILRSQYHTTRANLYAVFVNYMQYIQEALSRSPETDYDDSGGVGSALVVAGYGGGSLEARYSTADNPTMIYGWNTALLRKFGVRLLERACQDSMSGQLRVRAMAMVFLSNLLTYDHQNYTAERRLRQMRGNANASYSHASSSSLLDRKDNSLLATLCNKGHVHLFVSELLHPKRVAFLNGAIFSLQMEHYEQIITYEILASLLLKVALRKDGAKQLLEDRLVSRLAECSFLENYPEPSYGSEPELEHSVSKSSRYYQLLIPTLQMIGCMLTSIPKNKILREQVMSFLVQHRDVIHKILDDSVRGRARPGDSKNMSLMRHAQSTSNPTIAASIQASKLITGILVSLNVAASSDASSSSGSFSSFQSRDQRFFPFYKQLLEKLKRMLAELFATVQSGFGTRSARPMMAEDTNDDHAYATTAGSSGGSLANIAEPDNQILVYEIIRNILMVCSSHCRDGKEAVKKLAPVFESGSKSSDDKVSLDVVISIFVHMLDTSKNPDVPKHNDSVGNIRKDLIKSNYQIHLSVQVIENILQILYYHIRYFSRDKTARQNVRKVRQLLDQLERMLGSTNALMTNDKGEFMAHLIRRIKRFM